ncbi:MAG: ribosome silencing factor [Gammaproteobacteria bacterium]
MNKPRSSARKPAKKAVVRKVAKPRKAPATVASTASGRKSRSLPPALRTVEAALSDMKAVDVKVLDVRGMSDVADFMVIASGTSDRHLRSIADRVVQMAKASGQRPLGVEGEQQGEWVLVDLPDVMVHIMLPRTREFYQLEHLWESRSSAPRNSGVGGKRASAARG